MEGLCHTAGCENKATHLTSTETKIVEICKDCYQKKYKS